MKVIFTIIFSIYFFSTSFGQNAKATIPDSLCFHNFGLPAYQEFNIKDSIANTMGFDYKFVAGCVLVPGQMEKIQEHNKEVRARLNKLLGPNWEQEFKKNYQEVVKVD